MFRPLIRINKEISTDEAIKLLISERRGVIAVNGDDGYPYAMPINYYYDKQENKIYFHGAKAGHRADSLKNSDKISFTVYGNETIKEEAWAPYLNSVVIFGRCRPMEDAAALDKIRLFAMKYYPSKELVEEEIAVSGKAVQMYEIEIEHLCGKQIQEK